MKQGHPELHRKLAWYHFKKWLFPLAEIPVPTMSIPETNLTAKPSAKPGGFLDELDLRWIDGERPYQLMSEYGYDSDILGYVLIVPVGYKTDFASIPRIFWRILPPHGPYVPAAVVHDYLCDLRGRTGVDSKTTHKVFDEAMRVLHVPKWKRTVMYRAVKWFGPKFKAKT